MTYTFGVSIFNASGWKTVFFWGGGGDFEAEKNFETSVEKIRIYYNIFLRKFFI
jgi:hypothetical protein